MTRRPAPIAADPDRRAIAWLVGRIAPDWDRAGIHSALAKAATQDLAQLAVAAIVATVTRGDQRTPAVLAASGDHWLAALNALGQRNTGPSIDRTAAGERVTELGRAWCVCGVWESHHVGARVQDCPGYTPEPDWTPADPDRIARLRAAMTEKEDHA